MFFLLVLACDPASDEQCVKAAEEPQKLTVGTGETEFVAVTEGEALGLTYGSQGGMHVWGSLQVSGIVQGVSDSLADPDNPMVSFVIKDEAVEIAGFHDIPHHFTVGLDGAWQFVGDRLVLFESDPAMYAGVPLVMSASLEDACGTKLTAEAEVVLDVDG